MVDASDSETALRGNRIVCFALLAGQAMFAIVIVVLQAGGLWTPIVEPGEPDICLIIGCAAAFVAIPLAYVVRKAIWQQGAGREDDQVMTHFLTGNIAFQAILEGGSLLNLVLWLITGEAMPYAICAGVLFAIGAATLLQNPAPE